MRGKRIILMLLLTMPSLVCSQNLVSNPSFECGTDNCDRDQDSRLFNAYACQWFSATNATPDIFSTSLSGTSCFGGQPNSEDPSIGQPGSQLPHSGKRFAGIFAYGNRTGIPPEYREYIETALTHPLTIGRYYRASMYVSLASRMVFASNNLGFYFSVGGFQNFTTNEALTFYQPQIVESEIITSTQWTRVCGIFLATEAATVVTIGNFSNDESTQVINLKGYSDDYYENSYYFVDDVTVEEVPGPDALSISVNGIKTICQNQSTVLSVPQTFDWIKWTTLQDTIDILSKDSLFEALPEMTTTYRVTAKSCATTVHDTVTVHVNPTPQINLGNDTTLCVGEKINLSPGIGFSSYSWENGSSNSNLIVTTAGTYSVTVKNQFGCTAEDSINIDFISRPNVELGKDTLVCSNFIQLNASNKKSNYFWSSGSMDSVYTPTKAGEYWVIVDNQCGTASDTINVYAASDAFIPNVLTLNNDTLNYKFKIKRIGQTSFSLKVINRWGEEVFVENPYRHNWPVNDDLPADTYYFIVEFRGCGPQKGWIQILR